MDRVPHTSEYPIGMELLSQIINKDICIYKNFTGYRYGHFLLSSFSAPFKGFMAVECISSSFMYRLCTYLMRHFMEKQHFFTHLDRRFSDCYLFIRKSTIPILYRNRMKNKETSMTFKSQHISVLIYRPADQVYEFVSNPENLPKWATGLSGSIKNVKGDWIAKSPMGRVKIKFTD